MSLSLSKGGNLSLSKAVTNLSKITVGLGWDAKGGTVGADFDLDASAFLMKGKICTEDNFVFYNKTSSGCGSVVHSGDNLTGSGDGDDESINIDLTRVPQDVTSIEVAVTIHDAEIRKQNFGQVKNAYIRVVDSNTNQEIARFDLTEDFSVETAMIFGEIYRHGTEWKFRAVGVGYQGGLRQLGTERGLQFS